LHRNRAPLIGSIVQPFFLTGDRNPDGYRKTLHDVVVSISQMSLVQPITQNRYAGIPNILVKKRSQINIGMLVDIPFYVFCQYGLMIKFFVQPSQYRAPFSIVVEQLSHHMPHIRSLIIHVRAATSPIGYAVDPLQGAFILGIGPHTPDIFSTGFLTKMIVNEQTFAVTGETL